jgi:hypothetical protein
MLATDGSRLFPKVLLLLLLLLSFLSPRLLQPATADPVV